MSPPKICLHKYISVAYPVQPRKSEHFLANKTRHIYLSYQELQQQPKISRINPTSNNLTSSVDYIIFQLSTGIKFYRDTLNNLHIWKIRKKLPPSYQISTD